MNITRLREIYNEDHTVRTFLDHMASRQRNQSETKVDRMLDLLRRDDIDVARSQIVQAFRQLQEAQCGQFVAGRRGWPSRFVWDVGSLAAARTASGEDQEIDAVQEEDDLSVDSEELEHVFNLRVALWRHQHFRFFVATPSANETRFRSTSSSARLNLRNEWTRRSLHRRQDNGRP